MPDSDIPDDVKAQAREAAGGLAGGLPFGPQPGDPPPPPEVIAPEVPMEDFDSYSADMLARLQAGELPPYDPSAELYPTEEVDPAELQQPLPTPETGIDVEP